MCAYIHTSWFPCNCKHAQTKKVLKEHRIRFLSFLGIATNARYVHNSCMLTSSPVLPTTHPPSLWHHSSSSIPTTHPPSLWHHSSSLPMAPLILPPYGTTHPPSLWHHSSSLPMAPLILPPYGTTHPPSLWHHSSSLPMAPLILLPPYGTTHPPPSLWHHSSSLPMAPLILPPYGTTHPPSLWHHSSSLPMAPLILPPYGTTHPPSLWHHSSSLPMAPLILLHPYHTPSLPFTLIFFPFSLFPPLILPLPSHFPPATVATLLTLEERTRERSSSSMASRRSPTQTSCV